MPALSKNEGSEFVGRPGASAYTGIQMQVGHNVGRLLDALDDAGVTDDTIFILTGDNAAGNACGSFPDEGGSKGPWQAIKGSISSKVPICRGTSPRFWNPRAA